MIKCQVCGQKQEIRTLVCENCGFHNAQYEFVNDEELRIWQEYVVKPCRFAYQNQVRIEKKLNERIDLLQNEIFQLRNQKDFSLVESHKGYMQEPQNAVEKAFYELGDIVFVDNNITVTYHGIYEFNGMFAQGYRIKFIVHNKSEYSMSVECLDIAVNDLVIEQADLVASDISPGRKVIDSALMQTGKLSMAGVSAVSDIETLEFQIQYESEASKQLKKGLSPVIKVRPIIVDSL